MSQLSQSGNRNPVEEAAQNAAMPRILTGDLAGSLIVGDGGTLLSHTSGTQGQNNTIIGAGAGLALTLACENTIIGANAAPTATDIIDSIVIGRDAGYSLTTPDSNCFIGSQAGYSTVTGERNTFIAQGAGYLNTANYNVFVGYDAGHFVTTGKENVFMGNSAGLSNATGDYNCIIGTGAASHQVATQAFSQCVIIGYHTCYDNTTGQYSVVIGSQACLNNKTGSYNTIVGTRAGEGVANNSHGSNTFIGYGAGHAVTTGSGSVCLGMQAGYYETGSSKLFIDNAPRTNEADGRAKALIYGIFAAAIADQSVQINGKFGCNGVTPPTQAAHIADATGAADVITRCNAILVVLENHGFIATS